MPKIEIRTSWLLMKVDTAYRYIDNSDINNNNNNNNTARQEQKQYIVDHNNNEKLLSWTVFIWH